MCSVEKAAQVFSLKLDNGHKTSCPWIDNSCDEKLAQFPPMADQELVDGYKQRLLALSELVALPLISTSAISQLKSSELELFLKNELTLACDDGLGGELKKAYLCNVIDTESAKKYYEVSDFTAGFSFHFCSLSVLFSLNSFRACAFPMLRFLSCLVHH